MPFYKFSSNDIFHNQIKTYPDQSFFIYDGNVYYNNQPSIKGAHVDNVGNVPTGYVSLYELNVDRQSSQLIYPFITKQGSLTSFSTISTTNFNNDFAYGDIVKGSYPLSASLSSSRFPQGQTRPHVDALRNVYNFYTPLSKHYAYSSSLGNKGDQELRFINIPSIFYASSIKKGSVSLKFYYTGSVMGELVDSLRNGELRQHFPQDSNSGSVAGVILYTEGIVTLTGSWTINVNNVSQYVTATPSVPRWIDFGIIGGNLPGNISASWGIDYQGTNYIPVKTMLAHAARGELNHSNNPTYIKYGSYPYEAESGSAGYWQDSNIPLKNIVSGTWAVPTASFEKVTYISRIGIYDSNKNLIGIAKLANPVRKRENDEFTFKLKLDF